LFGQNRGTGPLLVCGKGVNVVNFRCLPPLGLTDVAQTIKMNAVIKNLYYSWMLSRQTIGMMMEKK
jgi:hypothetical protein